METRENFWKRKTLEPFFCDGHGFSGFKAFMNHGVQNRRAKPSRSFPPSFLILCYLSLVSWVSHFRAANPGSHFWVASQIHLRSLVQHRYYFKNSELKSLGCYQKELRKTLRKWNRRIVEGFAVTQRQLGREHEKLEDIYKTPFGTWKAQGGLRSQWESTHLSSRFCISSFL